MPLQPVPPPPSLPISHQQWPNSRMGSTANHNYPCMALIEHGVPAKLVALIMAIYKLAHTRVKATEGPQLLLTRLRSSAWGAAR